MWHTMTYDEIMWHTMTYDDLRRLTCVFTHPYLWANAPVSVSPRTRIRESTHPHSWIDEYPCMSCKAFFHQMPSLLIVTEQVKGGLHVLHEIWNFFLKTHHTTWRLPWWYHIIVESFPWHYPDEGRVPSNKKTNGVPSSSPLLVHESSQYRHPLGWMPWSQYHIVLFIRSILSILCIFAFEKLSKFQRCYDTGIFYR